MLRLGEVLDATEVNFIRMRIPTVLRDRLPDPRYVKLTLARLTRKFVRPSGALRGKPAFLVGSGRSGTTLLAGLLGQHPDVLLFPREGNELWHPESYPYLEKRPPVPPIWQDPKRFTEWSLENRADADLSVVRSTFLAYERLAGPRRIFLCKTVMTNFMLDEILRAFPKARFIHIVRDGRAVALSYAHKQSRKLMAAEADLKLPPNDLIVQMARYWAKQLESIRRFMARLPPTRTFQVRYENLVREPRTVVEEVLEFLSVNPTVQIEYPPIDNRNEKFATLVDEELQVHVEAEIADELTALGYEVVR